MNRENRIKNLINEKLEPEIFEIKNNSHLHSGHLGDDGTNETHYFIKIKSNKFNDISRIESHKLINNILKNEFEKGLHALEIKVIK